ncbi:MAG: glycosyltransferase, partial [Phycisphaerae bacterium]|nr:glycosyltransferase [Phycisphaerae bacterium]
HLGRGASVVLAASQAIRRDVVKHHVAPAERVLLNRPGVYHVAGPTCFQQPDRSVSIVAGVGLNDFAAFDAALSSFAELRARSDDCMFFILGGGRAEKQLHRRAEELGMRGDLTFVGHLPTAKLSDVFAAADIYISPVPSAAVDMTSLLAMAAGVPVVAAVGGASDFLIDGRTALLFAPGETAELTSKLTSLLDDKAAARSLAQAALAHLHEHHSPAKVVAAVSELYRKAAKTPED